MLAEPASRVLFVLSTTAPPDLPAEGTFMSAARPVEVRFIVELFPTLFTQLLIESFMAALLHLLYSFS